MKLTVVFLLCLLVVGCQTPKTQVSTLENIPPVGEQSRSVTDEEAFHNELEEFKNLLNKNKAKKHKAVKVKHTRLTKKADLNIPMGSAEQLYGYLFKSWKSDNYDQVIAATSLLNRNFPNSKYIDDSRYILSKMDLRRGRFSETLRGVNHIITHHPQSPLMANALYLKAQAYKQMNLPSIQQQILKEIIQKHPNTKLSRKLRAQNLKK